MNSESQGVIIVNGEERPVPPDGSISTLLRAMGLDPAQRGVAVAVNGEVIPRQEWDSWWLAAGDSVELVGAVQGG